MVALSPLSHKEVVQNTRAIKLSRPEVLPAIPVIGYLASELPIFYAYIGDVAFNKLVKNFASANPEQHQNANYLKLNLPDYLRDNTTLRHNPEIFELACFELAINQAFAAADTAIINTSKFDAAFQRDPIEITLQLVESAQLLQFHQNTTSLWSALKCDEHPPKPHKLDAPQHVLIWRQRGAPRFRILGREEAKLFSLCAHKSIRTFGIKKLTEVLELDQSTAKITDYLRGWVEAELIAYAEAGF